MSKKSKAAAERDEKSRDKSTAILNDKITLVASSVRTRWNRNGSAVQYAEHDFTISDAPKFIYRLTIEQDQTIVARRYDKERPYNTPRSLSHALAKILYMKVWPNVGI